MSSKIDIENYLENQYRKCLEIEDKEKWNSQYEDFYQEINYDKLRDILTFLHSKVLKLFELMNGIFELLHKKGLL